jgi:tol-pal system protein YbgF
MINFFSAICPRGVSRMRRIVAFALIASGVLAAAPARAANKDIERLQVQVAALQGQIADMQRRAADNLAEIQRLTELVAEQNALLKRSIDEEKLRDEAAATTLKELGDRISEVLERIDALQVAGNVAAPVQPGTALGTESPEGATLPGGAPVPAPRELYSQAYADFARGNYDLAIQGFTEYMKYYPDTDFTDNAQYWIGECLYGKKEYAEAIEAWNTLFRDFETSDKVPDGRVKKGMALERLGRRSQALVEYRYVVDRYPESPAARIARERLNP